MPRRRSGVTLAYGARRRQSGVTVNTSPNGKLLALMSLSGTGSVSQAGTGAVSMALTLAGTSTVSQSGAGSVSASMALSGTGSVSQSGSGSTSMTMTLTGSGTVSSNTYTIFSQPSTPATLASDTTAGYTFCMEFSVNSTRTANGVWFFSASGAGSLPGSIALFKVSGTSTVTSNTASWSGSAGSGWVFAAFTSPPTLTASTAYKVGLYNHNAGATNWYSATAHYWDTGAGSGGLTNGPLTAPNNSTASIGQDSFYDPAPDPGVITYPNDTFNAANYWVDIEVQ